jgi:tryptophanyl-tRNA synthetase
MARRYRAGGLGYGHAKEALFEAIEARIGPARARYEALLAGGDEVEATLHDGARRARSLARATLSRVRLATGMGQHPRVASLP